MATGHDLLRLAHQLQPRDQVIAALLVEHRVLTTSQLAAVLFGSPAGGDRSGRPPRGAASPSRRPRRLAHGGCQVGFWLEYDTGTEPLHRLVAKIDPYARLRRIGGPDYPVLFHLPNQTREANLHRQLAECEDRLLTTVATTTPATVGGTEAGLAGPVCSPAPTTSGNG